MPLTKLQFRPGINRETTSYTNEGGWFDCDKVRFRAGLPEKIGGWERKTETPFLGTCRALHPWIALAGEQYLGIGTHLKYYIEEAGSLYDITPIRLTTAAGDATFSATDGETAITVTEDGHGAVPFDFVTFTDADSLGGDITATVLNQEHQITAVLDSNTYVIDPGVEANASDTGDGGSSTVAQYQINVGLDTAVAGNGWGAGVWSRGAWGSGTALTAVSDVLRIWSHDNFGEDLIINVRGGNIYYWDKSEDAGLTSFTRATALSDLTGADAGTPTVATKVLISDRDRHVIAFGADPVDNIGTQDPLLIRFSNQEDARTWIPTATNTAGDLRISTGSRIVTALETRQQILVFTDGSLHAMQYLGPPFTFGIQLISENTTIMGPNSAVAVDDSVFWMGVEEFYVYAGGVQPVPCAVRDAVFADINLAQRDKVFAGLNSSFGEVWWFYPSADSDNVDKYVIYNYQQNIWYIGTLDRTAWLDRGINTNPIATDRNGLVYLHESGFDDATVQPPVPIPAYIESSQIDIGDGNEFLFIRRLIPDVTFMDSSVETPTVTMTLKARNFPGGSYRTSDASTVSRSAVVPVEQFTEQAHVRLRGRSFALRVESDQEGIAWRLGSPRVDIRPDGER